MINFYYLVAAVSYGIFIIQFILSWFGGDADLDIDLDGEFDMDVSDLVSFKGLIHFLMGASGWLSIKNLTSSVEWYDFLIALAIGILFVIILYYLYKLILHLQHQVIPEEGEALIGKTCTVYIRMGMYQYILTTEINGTSEEIRAYPEVPDLSYEPGDQVSITKYEEGKYFFK